MGRFRRSPKTVPGRRQRSVSDTPADSERLSYMRNRTISGVEKRSYDQPGPSSRARAHHLTLHRRKIGGIFFIILLTVLLLGWLLWQLTARVVVTVGSTDISHSVDAAVYEKAINEYLDSHPIARLRFALDQTDLTAALNRDLPEVASVEQTGWEDVGASSFSLTFRAPVAGWQINGRQYYVDDQGVAFEKNYFTDPGLRIVDESGLSLEQGGAVTSIRFLGFVGRVVALSKVAGYSVTEAILPQGTTRQVQVRLEGVRPLVRLSIDRVAGEQVEDMARSLTYLSSRGMAPSYIDVRVSGKAFYQ